MPLRRHRNRSRPKLQSAMSRHEYRGRVVPGGEIVELYAAAGGRLSFTLASRGQSPAYSVLIPGGFRLSDLRGLEVAIPLETEEPVGSHELLALAREGRHGFRVLPDPKAEVA